VQLNIFCLLQKVSQNLGLRNRRTRHAKSEVWLRTESCAAKPYCNRWCAWWISVCLARHVVLCKLCLLSGVPTKCHATEKEHKTETLVEAAEQVNLQYNYIPNDGYWSW